MKNLIITILLLAVCYTLSAQTNFESDIITKKHEAVLYPNPTIDYKIKINSDDLISEIEILNVIGQSIYKHENENKTKDAITIQLDDCEKGLYLVKITFEDKKSIIKKLLVK